MKIFRPRREELRIERRKLNGEILRNLYSSSIIGRLINREECDAWVCGALW
jgi:hypothetical protein